MYEHARPTPTALPSAFESAEDSSRLNCVPSDDDYWPWRDECEGDSGALWESDVRRTANKNITIRTLSNSTSQTHTPVFFNPSCKTMGKKRSTPLSVLLPSFLQSPNHRRNSTLSTSSSPPSPDRLSADGSSHETSPYAEQVLLVPESVCLNSDTAWSLSPLSDSPPDLLGVDPFANLQSSRPTSLALSSRCTSPEPTPSRSASPISPFLKRNDLNSIPHSPLSPSSTSPVRRLTRCDLPTGARRLRPAHTRLAFAPRPSLPSLRVLARATLPAPSVPRGRVGAHLPPEPWCDDSRTDDVVSAADTIHDKIKESDTGFVPDSTRRATMLESDLPSVDCSTVSEHRSSAPFELESLKIEVPGRSRSWVLPKLLNQAKSSGSSPRQFLTDVASHHITGDTYDASSSTFLIVPSTELRPRSLSAPSSPTRPDFSEKIYGRQCASSWDPSGGRHGGYSTGAGTSSSSGGFTNFQGSPQKGRRVGGGGGLGGSGGDDDDDRHNRRPPANNHAFHSDGSDSESDSEDSDDDVPLAKKIPTALRAQKTIRRQVRDERHARRKERAERKEREAREGVLRARSVSRPRAEQVTPTSPPPMPGEAIPRGQGLARKRTVAAPSRQYIQEELSVRVASGVQLSDPAPPTSATVDSGPSLQRKRSMAARPGVSLVDAPVPPSPAPVSAGLERKKTTSSRPTTEANGFSPHPRTRSHTLTGQSRPPVLPTAAPEMPSWDPRLQPSTPSQPSLEAADVPQRSLRPMKSAVALGRSATTATRPRRVAEDYGIVTRSVTEAPARIERSRTVRQGGSSRTSDERRREAASAPGSRRPSAEHEGARGAPPMPPLPIAAPPVVQTKVPTTQQRVFVGDMQTFHTVEIGPQTSAGDVLNTIKDQGALSTWTGSGGWMLFEIAQDFGMERPIRNFELMADVLASWSNNKITNTFIAKLTPFAEYLGRSAIPTSSPTYGAYIEYEVKRGKWSKRWLQLKEHSLWIAKRDNGKDEQFLCSLSNFDAYTITRVYKAPKDFVFAIKSTDSLSFFEDASDYLHVFSCNERDSAKWLQNILLARSYVLHQERNVLVSKSIASANAPATGLTRSGTRKRPAQPLVNVNAIPPVRTAQMHNEFAPAPGTLLGNYKGPSAAV